jgi:hypothetical protein
MKKEHFHNKHKNNKKENNHQVMIYNYLQIKENSHLVNLNLFQYNKNQKIIKYLDLKSKLNYKNNSLFNKVSHLKVEAHH